MTLKDLSHQIGIPSSSDELLNWIGLQQRRTASDVSFTMLGAFALGTVVGGALALLFAPKPGHELRHDLGERLDDAKERLKGQLAPNNGGDTTGDTTEGGDTTEPRVS